MDEKNFDDVCVNFVVTLIFDLIVLGLKIWMIVRFFPALIICFVVTSSTPNREKSRSDLISKLLTPTISGAFVNI